MSVLKAMAERDRDALDAVVADDVVFNGPATAYEGREQVVEVLAIGARSTPGSDRGSRASGHWAR